MEKTVTRTVNTYEVTLLTPKKVGDEWVMGVDGIGQHVGTSCNRKDMRAALKRAGVHVKPGATMEAEIIKKVAYSVPWDKFMEIADEQELENEKSEAEVEE